MAANDPRFTLIPLAALAALPFVGLDLSAAGGALGLWGGVVAALLLVTTGSWLAILELSALVLLQRMTRCLPASLARRAGLWIVPALVALLLLPLYAWVFLKMFSGAGIRRSSLAGVMPWVLIPLGGVAVALGGRLFLWLRARSTRTRRAAALPVLGLAALVLALDRTLLPGGYADIHNAAAVLAVGLLQAGAALLAAPGLERWTSQRSRGFAALLAALLLATAAAAAVSERAVPAAVLFDSKHHTGRTAQIWRSIIDMDQDGFSSLWGGRDCDDFDGAIHPRALEIPANGIDEDCDGEDLSAEQVAAAAAFWRANNWRSLAGRSAVWSLRKKARGQNVLMITVDALRADVLAEAMPSAASRLPRLLGEGFHFRRAYSASSSTRLSLPALHTSRFFPASPGARQTLAGRLRQLRYRTAHVGNAHPVRFTASQRRELHRPFDLRAGFERVDLVEDRGARDRDLLGGGSKRRSDAEVTKRALQLLDRLVKEETRRPFFLWVHLFDLHQWQLLTSASDGSARERYRSLASSSLEQVERLLRGLEQRGFSSSTIVLFSADHGEALGERDLYQHTEYVYDFLVHVPLVIWLPGQRGRAIDTPVAHLDLMPTLVELVSLGDCRRCQGDSLLPLLAGSDPPPRAILVRDNEQLAIIDHGWKLIWTPTHGLVELYRLGQEDPGSELSREQVKTAKELLLKLRFSPLQRAPVVQHYDRSRR